MSPNSNPRLGRRRILTLAALSPLLLHNRSVAGEAVSVDQVLAGTPETGARGFDIVDAQVHIRHGEIESTLAAMDALGIRSVMLDEFWGIMRETHPTHFEPGYQLPNGAWRAAWPTAELASLLHPDRFAYLIRIDRRDPDLESVMRTIVASPQARAFRVQPVWTREDVADLAGGGYDDLLALAQDLGLPVCFFIPGHVELLRPYIAKFPRLTFVIDHCGMGFPFIPLDQDPAAAQRTQAPAYLDEVLTLAEFPNVALKWSHAQDLFGVPAYPYEPLRPLLRKTLQAFGSERVMWASDHTVIPGHSWSDLLTSLRDDSELSPNEKAWLLGRAARTIFQWPAAV